MKCACRKNPERTAFEVFPKSIIDNDEEIVVGIWLPRDQIRIVDYILMMWIDSNLWRSGLVTSPNFGTSLPKWNIQFRFPKRDTKLSGLYSSGFLRGPQKLLDYTVQVF